MDAGVSSSVNLVQPIPNSGKLGVMGVVKEWVILAAAENVRMHCRLGLGLIRLSS